SCITSRAPPSGAITTVEEEPPAEERCTSTMKPSPRQRRSLLLHPLRAPGLEEARKPHHEAAQGDGVSAEGQRKAGRDDAKDHQKEERPPQEEAKDAGRDQRRGAHIATSSFF